MNDTTSGPAKTLQLPADDAVLINRIREFIADALDRPVEEVGPDDDIYDELGLESLGAIAVFIDLSYEYGVPDPDPDDDLRELRSARRLAAYARSFA